MLQFLFGLITGLLVESAKRSIWGPRLRVEYRDRGPEFIVETTAYIHQVRGGSVERSRRKYVRLKVINDGHDVAKNCYGYLTDVKRWNGNSFEGIGFHDTIPLCWSYLDANGPQRIDIIRGVPQYLDIFVAEEFHAYIEPRVIAMPHVYQKFFDEFREGRLQFSVVIAGEGTDPILRLIEVNWKGSWESFDVHCRSVDGFE